MNQLLLRYGFRTINKSKTHHSEKACQIVAGVTVEYLTTSKAILTEVEMLPVKIRCRLNLLLPKLFFYLLSEKGISK